ncbi:MAG: flavodoxin domain-containing protein, partial [Chitinophagaceae bacterium]
KWIMKGIIVYKGKYGATMQYAQWLAEELNLLTFNVDGVPPETLLNFDFMIIGSSVYIGKLQISKWLGENLAAIRDKKIFFFQVAGTPPEETEKVQAYIRSGVPAEILGQAEVFFYPGKMIFKELSWKDRLMLKMGARLTKDPAARKTMLTDYNRVKKENISGLVDAVNKFCAAKKEILQPVKPREQSTPLEY